MARLILGLGNPGEEYRDTRHNVGFRVVEELARRWQVALDRLECNALDGLRGRGARARGALLAAAADLHEPQRLRRALLAERHELDPASVLVVYDEVNLPLGKLRLRRAGSPAGHRGLESILESLRTAEVPRLRLGVAPEGDVRPSGEELADFVLLALRRRTSEEETDAMIRRAADAVEVWLGDGADAAMGKFNG